MKHKTIDMSIQNLYNNDKIVEVQITLIRYFLPVFIIIALLLNSYALFKIVKVNLITNKIESKMHKNHITS